MKPLFVYGTLCPGRSNAHILETIGGEWRPGYVTGTFYARGWGAAADFPGIVLDANGPRVNGYLFLSDRLAAHWPMLDEFEEGYDRVSVEVTTDDGQQVSAWIYQLQPRSNLRRERAVQYSSPARSRLCGQSAGLSATGVTSAFFSAQQATLSSTSCAIAARVLRWRWPYAV